MSKRRRLSHFGDEGRTRRRISLSITLPARVAVVSDSHSVMHPNTVPMLTALKPDYILHAGDIGQLHVISDLESIAPVVAVRGNIDMPSAEIADDVLLDITLDSQTVSTWLLTHIAVRGPRILKPVFSFAKQRRVAMVVCGHSHVPFLTQQEGVTVFNPGSVGPRRFHLPIVFGLVTISAQSIKCEHMNCETGEVWRP